jgi:DNA (cytosine-5)-methyltransferase 1
MRPKVPDVRAALEGLDDSDELANHPILRHVLRKGPTISRMPTHARHVHRPSRSHPQLRRLPGNVDLAVLRRENQTATHVTPRIDSYAHGLFREQLCVVGPPPIRPRGPSPVQAQEMRVRLLQLLEKASDGHRPAIEMRRDKRLNSRSVWMTEVKIDGEVFSVSLQFFPPHPSDIFPAR